MIVYVVICLYSLMCSFSRQPCAVFLDRCSSLYHANDSPDDGDAIQDALKEISNQRTVPNIFIAQKHIGGNSDLQAKKAELPQLLKAAGAV